jgi:aspartate aminotransferase-like enzyme/N-acyl-L-homoserine lactone synthetase
MTGIQFKEAETPEEIDQIHRLNHKIFAEEIAQHPSTSSGQLIDRFHASNRYFIATHNTVIAGMISVHDGPHFSVAKRLADPSILSNLRAPLEVRLLAIRPGFRNRSVLAGLLWQVLQYAQSNHFSDLVISGIVQRQPMYRKMGFLPLGPPVPDGAASFVPMRLSLESMSTHQHNRQQLYAARWNRNHPLSLLPGPVAIAAPVVKAFQQPPLSHRSPAFLEIYEQARSRLSGLMGGMQTVILGGSGTLANDAVAANLHAAFGTSPGLILANGEFGDRLFNQANRSGLHYRALRFKWGEPWNFSTIQQALQDRPAWIWAVHLETSTGVLNNLPRLLHLAGQHAIPVAADCVSSLGAVAPNSAAQAGTASLFLATGVSGKALSAYAGLSFVFVSDEAADRLQGKILCPTFDLVGAIQTRGPSSTVSSPLVCALAEALQQNYATPAAAQARYRHYEELGRASRTELRALGLKLLAPEDSAAPIISTFPLPSRSFPWQCLRAGFRIAHESDYLRAHNWGQIAVMGDISQATLSPLFSALHPNESLQPA